MMPGTIGGEPKKAKASRTREALAFRAGRGETGYGFPASLRVMKGK